MKPLCILLSLGLVATATAQTTPPIPEHDHVHLDEFEVTTHPYARSQSEIAQPTTVLGGEALDLRQGLNLGDLVSLEPGVSTTYFGPGAGRPVIRGMAGPRVAVLQNGSDMIDASTISPDHAVSLDPLLIERVEITRGPAALIHGGTAIGGAVNVVTHRIHTSLPEAGVHGRVEGRMGSVDDEISGGLVLEGAVGQLAWHVDSFYRETDDIDIPGFAESSYLRRLEELEEEEEHHDEDEHDDEHHDEDDHDEEHDDDEHEHEEEEEAFGTVPNTFVETQGGACGLSWITETGYIGASFSVFDSNYGIPAGAHSHEHGHEDGHEDEDHDEDEHDEEHEDEEHGHDEEGEEFVSIDLEQRRFELAGEFRDLEGFQALQWQLAWAEYEHTEFEGDEVGTVFTNEGFDLRVDALHQPWGEWQGAIGFEWSHSDFDAVGAEAFLPPSETDTLSLMIFEERETGPNIYQVSARVDSQSIDVTDGTQRENSGTGWATSFGVVHTISEEWSIATSASLTERLPITQELYADGPHIGTGAYEIGDATLDNERSLGIDISLRKSGDFFSGVVTGFYNDFNGYIYENPTGEEEDELPVYQFTQRDARFYGMEASGMLHVLATDHGHLDLPFGVDFVEAENRTDGTDLPRIPPVRYRAGAVWEYQALRLGTEIIFADGQDNLAPEELPTDAYELWSAYAAYRFIAGDTTWDLLLRGTNLTDSEARLHTSFLKDVAPLPGRNVTVSLRMSF